MHRMFRNPDGQLRNGWWIAVFLLLFLASRLLYHPVSQALQHAGIGKLLLQPLPFVFALLVTWCCTRLRREPLASVGLAPGSRWGGQALVGVAFGTAAMLAVAALITSFGAVRWSLDPGRGFAAMASAAWVFAWVALFEELLFRGFVFQRLAAGTRPWIAQLALAALFAIAHWGNPGMDGATKAWATLDTALGAMVLGLAYLRTGSLALPIGIHFGWNWTQGALLGFDVSGLAQAGWLHPTLLDRPTWMTGGGFGPESTVFAVAIDLLSLAVLWKWRGFRVHDATRRDAAGGLATRTT